MALPRLQSTKDKRALVIVAHPDDETIWMGGFILAHPEFDWTIFSLCRASDPDRAPKFRQVCKYYGAKAIITDLEDDGKLSVKQSLLIIKNLILKKIHNQKFNFLFTHGTNGEYGHPRHIGVNQAVRNLLDKKKISSEIIFYFSYKKISRKQFTPLTARLDSHFTFYLTKKEFVKKKRIMTDIYSFAANSIDTNYCTNPEAFKTKMTDKMRNLE